MFERGFIFRMLSTRPLNIDRRALEMRQFAMNDGTADFARDGDQNLYSPESAPNRSHVRRCYKGLRIYIVNDLLDVRNVFSEHAHA